MINPLCAFCRQPRGSADCRFTAYEMQFGLPGEFEYTQCSFCGSLNLLNQPPDLSCFYPPNYYSFNVRRGLRKRAMRVARGFRDRYVIRGKGVLGRLLHRLVPKHPLGFLGPCKVDLSWRILDVGAGDGDFVLRLRDAGFHNAVGIDPFVKSNVKDGERAIVVRCAIGDMEGQFDLITFNHSLEHISNPFEALNCATALLAPNGRLVLQLPLADSYGFRKFGNAWYALDAPRHLGIPSSAGIVRLGELLDLQLVRQIRWTSMTVLANSYLYRSEIEEGRLSTRAKRIVTSSLRKSCQAELAKLSHSKEGDCGAFVLCKRRDVAKT